MLGDLADKNLAKALKKEDKRKREAKDEKEKTRKKPQFSRGGYRPQPYNAFPPMMGWPQFPFGNFPQVATPGQSVGPAFQNAPAPFYGPRPETRTCLNCRQVGHLAKNCPMKPAFPAPSAAAGAPPK